MSRHFLCYTKLAAIEQMMLLPPNFSPRSSGFQIGYFIYSADDVDCRYCTDYRRKKCAVSRCSWLKERIEAGIVTYEDLVTKCFDHLKNPHVKKRIHLAAVDFHGWLYLDYLHTERLAWVWQQFSQSVTRKPSIFAAALHLLTATPELWTVAERGVTENVIDFSRVKLRGISMDNYILYQTAKSICTGEPRITAADLADESIVNDDLLKIIINAILIARFGCDVYLLNKGGESL